MSRSSIDVRDGFYMKPNSFQKYERPTKMLIKSGNGGGIYWQYELNRIINGLKRRIHKLGI